MSIDSMKIERTTILAPEPTLAPSKSALPDQPQHAGSTDPIIGDQVVLSGTLDRKFKDLQLKNEQQNSVAGAIHRTDRAAHDFGQKIDALKAPLTTIVKTFPPYTPEDKARMKLLMNYASIKKEIDQLTLPAPPEVVRTRKALDLPPTLPSSASDSQIADHVAKLDATAASLTRVRDGLAADTAALLHDGRFSHIFSVPKGAETAQSGPVLNVSSAAQKSLEVGQQFAQSFRQGVTSDHSQFLKGLS